MRLVNSWKIALKLLSWKYGTRAVLRSLYLIEVMIRTGEVPSFEEVKDLYLKEDGPIDTLEAVISFVGVSFVTYSAMKYDGCSWKNIGHEKKMIDLGKFTASQIAAIAAPSMVPILLGGITRILDHFIIEPKQRFNLFEDPAVYESFKKCLMSTGFIGILLSGIYSAGAFIHYDAMIWRSKK